MVPFVRLADAVTSAAAWWATRVLHRGRGYPEPGTESQHDRHRPPAPADRPAQPSAPLADTLAELSVPELCRVWRVSYLSGPTCGEVAAMERIALVRRYYLDELERRDPAGFDRWIDAGAPAVDPARFIHDATDPPATSTPGA